MNTGIIIDDRQYDLIQRFSKIFKTLLGYGCVLPLERRDKDMGTNNIYNFMDPEDELYREGLMEDDWIVENIDWLSDVFIDHNIPLEEETMRSFYQAVNKEDWRCGSCGGCI